MEPGRGLGAVPESHRAAAGHGSEHPESPNRLKTPNPGHSRVYPDFSAFPKIGRSAPGEVAPQPAPPWDMFASFPNLSHLHSGIPVRISQSPSQLFCVLDLGTAPNDPSLPMLLCSLNFYRFPMVLVLQRFPAAGKSSWKRSLGWDLPDPCTAGGTGRTAWRAARLGDFIPAGITPGRGRRSHAARAIPENRVVLEWCCCCCFSGEGGRCCSRNWGRFACAERGLGVTQRKESGA